MREITTHVVNQCNNQISLEALDGPGPGGASHHYRIGLFNEDGHSIDQDVDIRFQNGPIKESGVNGITQEVLLAIVKDRLEGFQSGEFANEYNEEALVFVDAAIRRLHQRTLDREARGVEGTHQK